MNKEGLPRIGIPAPYTIYNDRNFLRGFTADIHAAKHHIIIQSAFISTQRIQRLADALRDAVQHGVRICAFVQQPRNFESPEAALGAEAVATLRQFRVAVDLLRSMSIHVTMRERVHEKLAAFDEQVLWDGSMNILSHYDTSERMTRWDSPAETLATIGEHNLLACAECAEAAPLAGYHENADQWLRQLGSSIRRQRIAAGLTQRQLAERVDVSHSLLGQLERGNRKVSAHVLWRICLAVGMDLSIHPRGSKQSA